MSEKGAYRIQFREVPSAGSLAAILIADEKHDENEGRVISTLNLGVAWGIPDAYEIWSNAVVAVVQKIFDKFEVTVDRVVKVAPGAPLPEQLPEEPT